MPTQRAAQREKTSAALKAKATPARKSGVDFDQRKAAQKNARTVTQAKRAAGVAPTAPQEKTPVTVAQNWIKNLGTSLAGAAKETGQAYQKAAATVWNTTAVPLWNAPVAPYPSTPMDAMQRRAEEMQNYYFGPQEAMQRRAEEMNNWYLNATRAPQLGRKGMPQPAPEGYTAPVGPTYPSPTSAGGAGGYSSSPAPTYPSYGGRGGVYAQAGQPGYNPMRSQVPAWWHQRLTWRW